MFEFGFFKRLSQKLTATVSIFKFSLSFPQSVCIRDLDQPCKIIIFVTFEVSLDLFKEEVVGNGLNLKANSSLTKSLIHN